jgi:TPP-dependent indolepyruvate ferredoxin oxidoreductase alpha subunit
MPAIGNIPFKLQIDELACRHCRRCLAAETCRGKAFLVLDPEDGVFIDMSRCWGCLKCVAVCPFGAVIKVEYGVDTTPA